MDNRLDYVTIIIYNNYITNGGRDIMSTQAEAAPVWGGLVVRGIIAILFGIAAVFWPGLTLVTLVYLFSAFILVSGIVGLVTNLSGLTKSPKTYLAQVLRLIVSLIEIGVGVYLLRHPSVSFATFIVLIGFVLIARGVFDIIAALFTDNVMGHKAMTFLIGALAIIVGIIVLFQPVKSGVAFVWLLGLYALITGPLMIALAYDVKEVSQHNR